MDQYDVINGDRRSCSPILRARLSPFILGIIQVDLKYNREVGRRGTAILRLNQAA